MHYSPVRHYTPYCYNVSFDLHVLATPPAFVLSQDQTLRLIPGSRAVPEAPKCVVVPRGIFLFGFAARTTVCNGVYSEPIAPKGGRESNLQSSRPAIADRPNALTSLRRSLFTCQRTLPSQKDALR